MYMVTMAMVVLFTLDFVDINLRDPPVCQFAMPISAQFSAARAELGR